MIKPYSGWMDEVLMSLRNRKMAHLQSRVQLGDPRGLHIYQPFHQIIASAIIARARTSHVERRTSNAPFKAMVDTAARRSFQAL